jgi:hypothetical protein
MKKKYLLVLLGIIGILFLLLFSMRIAGRPGWGQRFPRLYQWLESRQGLELALEDLGSEEGGFQKETYAHNYWSHTELPEMTLVERLKVAIKAKFQSQKYVQENNDKAQVLSEELENYIRRWLRGEVSARLPDDLLPESIDNSKTKDWTLMRPEEVTPEEQWIVIPSHQNDPEYKKLYMLGTDPHVTYGKLIFVAPIDSKLLIEGDFPHARYMNYEILPPFDPKHPASGTMGETPEVPIVDVDIEPDPGHINPFRVGADRPALKRHYRLSFDLQVGNAVALNSQAMKAPEYRAATNTRVGGPFGFAGPWGSNVLTPSLLWLRIYAPDKTSDVFGGVSLPKAVLQLKTGEKFWLQPDFSLALERANTQVPAGYQAPQEPYPFIGPQHGWFKIFGLALVRAENAGYRQSEPYGKQSVEKVKERIRQAFLLLFNRGENAEPPGNYEGSATACKNNNFLTRMFQLGPGKVYVITGKMPNFPKTRNGEPVMTGGGVRYWSISQYGAGEDDKYETAVNYGSLMDDEVVLNDNNEYIIVYSTKEDRPKNAVAENGITWIDWGPRARQTITVRWMNVMPEWHLPQYAPDEYNLPWSKAAWSATQYDETLVGQNTPGVMGSYHPVIHYMTKEEFEALGYPVDPKEIPEWK